MDLFLGIARLVILASIIAILWRSGAGDDCHSRLGWRFILGGFLIILATEFFFTVDEWPPFHDSVRRDFGASEDVLIKTIGYICGFMMLGFGVLKWVPNLRRLATEISERKKSEVELMRTYDNVNVLIREQTAELQMAVNGLEAEVEERRFVEAELSRHQTHLEGLVVKRTKEINEQKVQLEKALEQEKEYSARQREFVSLVSHEFRTPLTIIDGSIQRMMRRKNELSPDEVVTRGLKIRGAVQRMTGLIEATLYGSRMDEGKIKMMPSVCDIRRVVKEACDRQVEISPTHKIKVEINALPDNILADFRLMSQVVANLISNAVKYSPQSTGIHVSGWTEGDNAFVSVRDHGVGISKDELPRLFERFFRARTSEGIPGTGLGLSIAKQMIEMHGGKIWVESIKDEGSTFTISIPTHENSKNYNNQTAGIIEGAVT